MFSGFHLTGLPELLSTSPHSANYKKDILKTHSSPHGEWQTRIFVCENGKSKGRRGEHNGPTSLNSPSPNPILKSTQLPCIDRKDNWSWNRFFLSQNRNLKKPNFRWLAALVPSWMAEQWRQTGSGGTSLGKAPHSPARRPNQPFAVHDAFCMMLLRWPEMSVWGATVRVWCNDIICDPSCVVWQQSRMVLLPLESWTQVTRISQWVRTGG